MQHLHDRDARVEPDQVGERERPHRMREAELRDRVDRLRLGDALHQRVGGLVDERHQDAVRDEAGEVARLGGRLAEFLARAATIAAAVSSEVWRPRIDLDELQHRHRVEEVHADDAVRPPGRRGQRRDRDRGRVRGEDRLVREELVGAPEHVLLHGRVLDDRLDQQVGRRRGRRPARCARAPRPGPGRPSRRAASRLFSHRREPAVDRPRAASWSETRRPSGHDLRDAAAHLAGADDEHVLECRSGIAAMLDV